LTTSIGHAKKAKPTRSGEWVGLNQNFKDFQLRRNSPETATLPQQQQQQQQQPFLAPANITVQSK
jgi:hypothetical protein